MSPEPAPPAGYRPPRVGLTGGIASGKTSVALLFGALEVPVIDADQEAFLMLRFRLAKETSYAAAGHETAWIQLPVPAGWDHWV